MLEHWAWNVCTNNSDEPMLIITQEPTLLSLHEIMEELLEDDDMVTKVEYLTDVQNKIK